MDLVPYSIQKRFAGLADQETPTSGNGVAASGISCMQGSKPSTFLRNLQIATWRRDSLVFLCKVGILKQQQAFAQPTVCANTAAHPVSSVAHRDVEVFLT